MACLQNAAKAQDEVAELVKSSSVNCYSRKADIFRILVRVEENMDNFDRVRLEQRVNRAGCGWQVLEGAARELGEPRLESRADAAPLVISHSYLSKTAVIKPAKGAQQKRQEEPAVIIAGRLAKEPRVLANIFRLRSWFRRWQAVFRLGVRLAERNQNALVASSLR